MHGKHDGRKHGCMVAENMTAILNALWRDYEGNSDNMGVSTEQKHQTNRSSEWQRLLL